MSCYSRCCLIVITTLPALFSTSGTPSWNTGISFTSGRQNSPCTILMPADRKTLSLAVRICKILQIWYSHRFIDSCVIQTFFQVAHNLLQPFWNPSAILKSAFWRYLSPFLPDQIGIDLSLLKDFLRLWQRSLYGKNGALAISRRNNSLDVSDVTTSASSMNSLRDLALRVC